MLTSRLMATTFGEKLNRGKTALRVVVLVVFGGFLFVILLCVLVVANNFLHSSFHRFGLFAFCPALDSATYIIDTKGVLRHVSINDYSVGRSTEEV